MNTRLATLIVMMLGTVLVSSCSDTTQAPEPPVATTATISIASYAGTKQLLMDSTFMTENSVPFTVSKYRFYISDPALLDSSGKEIPITFADSAGNPLLYNSWLFDFDRPSTWSFKINATSGTYTGIAFSFGIPSSINHEDASLKQYPLDINSDMFWVWSSGYVFFKIEGKSEVSKQWLSYVFHYGLDTNYVRRTIRQTVQIARTGSTQLKLRTNVSKLFITSFGDNRPDLSNPDIPARSDNTGELSAQVARNSVESGFITLDP